MELDQLSIASTQVKDLSPLRGMKTLKRLYCNDSLIGDLSPLAGLRLEQFQYYGTSVRDISILRDMPLEQVWWNHREGERDILRSIPTLKMIQNKPVDVYWKEVDAKNPLDSWIKDVQKLPAEKQVEAVRAELMKRNPGFDGKLKEKLEGGVVTALQFLTDNVTDISPVRALSGLRQLDCSGTWPNRGQLADLSPLKGMNLTKVSCSATRVTDLSPLKEMKLTDLWCAGTPVADLAPLKDMPLTKLQIYNTKVSDLSPLKGMPLTTLGCNQTKVTDLSPLKGMPLQELFWDVIPERDADVLRLDQDAPEDQRQERQGGVERTLIRSPPPSPLRGMELDQLGIASTQVRRPEPPARSEPPARHEDLEKAVRQRVADGARL